MLGLGRVERPVLIHGAGVATRLADPGSGRRTDLEAVRVDVAALTCRDNVPPESPHEVAIGLELLHPAVRANKYVPGVGVARRDHRRPPYRGGELAAISTRGGGRLTIGRHGTYLKGGDAASGDVPAPRTVERDGVGCDSREGELLHPSIALVGHIDRPVHLIDSDPLRSVERPADLSGRDTSLAVGSDGAGLHRRTARRQAHVGAPRPDEVFIGIELLDAMVRRVDHEDVANPSVAHPRPVDLHPKRLVEQPAGSPGRGRASNDTIDVLRRMRRRRAETKRDKANGNGGKRPKAPAANHDTGKRRTSPSNRTRDEERTQDPQSQPTAPRGLGQRLPCANAPHQAVPLLVALPGTANSEFSGDLPLRCLSADLKVGLET